MPPPLYQWRDKNTDTEVEVLRSLSDSEVVPTLEESKMGPEEYEAADWQKILGGFMLTRGSNWRGSKGNW